MYILSGPSRYINYFIQVTANWIYFNGCITSLCMIKPTLGLIWETRVLCLRVCIICNRSAFGEMLVLVSWETFVSLFAIR